MRCAVMAAFSQSGQADPPGSSGSDADAAARPRIRHRVLVVDDEADVRETLADILEGDGYLVDSVESGRAAIERLRGNDYSVVLCDLRMADIDGMAFYHHVKASAPALAERTILVTGDILNARINAFLAENQVTCIEKPFFPKDVRRVVAETLTNRRTLPPAAVS